MQIEIKCGGCGNTREHKWIIENDNGVELMVDAHCPTCEEAMDEKKNPKKNEWIEVKNRKHIDDCFSRRIATGKRSKDGRVCAKAGTERSGYPWDLWRRIGSKEWNR